MDVMVLIVVLIATVMFVAVIGAVFFLPVVAFRSMRSDGINEELLMDILEEGDGVYQLPMFEVDGEQLRAVRVSEVRGLDDYIVTGWTLSDGDVSIQVPRKEAIDDLGEHAVATERRRLNRGGDGDE